MSRLREFWGGIVPRMARARLRRFILYGLIGFLPGILGGALVAVAFWFLWGRYELALIPLGAFTVFGVAASLYIGWPTFADRGRSISE